MKAQPEFVIAYHFLDRFKAAYAADFTEDLIDLLSSMSPYLWANGGSADPALVHDWEQAAQDHTGLDALIAFLQLYRAIGEGDQRDITRLLEWIEALPNTAQQWWQDTAQTAAALP